MLADSLAVTTLVVTDLDRSKKFYEEQLGLKLLEETPFTCRFGAGKGSQISIRRGQPPVSGPTVAPASRATKDIRLAKPIRFPRSRWT